MQELYLEVKVKKKVLDWDPYAIGRIDREYALLVKDEVPEFKLIKDIKQCVKPLSIEELKTLTIDYNAAELDNQLKEIPTDYEYEDDAKDSTEKEKKVSKATTGKAII